MKKLALIMSLFVMVFAMTSCGGANSTPEDAVKTLIKGIQQGDASAIAGVIGDAQGNATELPEGFSDELAQMKDFMNLITFEVGTATIDGDTATVPVTVKAMGQETTQDMPCKKGSDGKWRVTSTNLL